MACGQGWTRSWQSLGVLWDIECLGDNECVAYPGAFLARCACPGRMEYISVQHLTIDHFVNVSRKYLERYFLSMPVYDLNFMSSSLSSKIFTVFL